MRGNGKTGTQNYYYNYYMHSVLSVHGCNLMNFACFVCNWKYSADTCAPRHTMDVATVIRTVRFSLIVIMSVVNVTTEPLLTLEDEGVPDCKIFLAPSSIPGSACVHIDIGFILCYALFAFIVVACGCINNGKLWLVAVAIRILYVLWISKRYAQ